MFDFEDDEDELKEVAEAYLLILVACAGVVIATIVGLTAFTFWMIAKF